MSGTADGRVRAPFGARTVAVTARDRLGAYVVLRCADPDGPRPQAGQFYMLSAAARWGGGEGERPFLPRAFSVLRAPAGTDELQFMLEDVGPGTRRLCELAPGDGLTLVGPLGNGFAPPREDRRALLVGGGVGIGAAGDRLRRAIGWRRSHWGNRPEGGSPGGAARLPRRRPRRRRRAARRRPGRHRRRLARPPRPRHRAARRRTGPRSARRGLCVRAAARCSRPSGRCVPSAGSRRSSHSSQAWRAGSAPASAVSSPTRGRLSAAVRRRAGPRCRPAETALTPGAGH